MRRNVVFSVSKLQIWERFTTRLGLKNLYQMLFSVCQSYKFESDSQPVIISYTFFLSCFQCVKVTNLRAIHNPVSTFNFFKFVVFSVSKLQIWERFTRKQIYLYWLFALTFCFSKILRIFAQTERSGTLRSVRCGGATAPYRFFVGNTFLTLDSNKMGKNARSIVWKNIFIYSE